MRDLCQKLIEARVVPVLRLESAALTEKAVQCLVDVGFGAIEITMTTPDALSLIKSFSGAKLPVGAGTVLDAKTAQGCLDAGAQFLVAPFVFPELVAIGHQGGKPVLLGAFTPSEVLGAHRAGADIVKVFPASSGGPAHLAALHSVYPEVRLCPTGGVSRENMEKYFAAGAALVGVGNAIVPLASLKSGDLDAVRAHAAAYLGRSFT